MLCKHTLLLLVLFSIQHQNNPVKIQITPHHSSVHDLLASPSGENPKRFPAGAAHGSPHLSQSRGTCTHAHTGTFLPRGLPLFPLPEPTFPREPRGLLPRFTQISSSPSSNITFSMRSSQLPYLKLSPNFLHSFLSALFHSQHLSPPNMLYIVLIYFVYYLSLSIRL